MMVRNSIIIAAGLVLAACGKAELTLDDRIELVGDDCRYLASNADFKTGDVEAATYCACIVTDLGNMQSAEAEAVSHTFAYISKQHRKNGGTFDSYATTFKAAAKAPNAQNYESGLGIGLKLMDDVITRVNKRADDGDC